MLPMLSDSMMKLLVLLMLAQSALSSDSSEQQNSTKPVEVLNPSLENVVPAIIPKKLTAANKALQTHSVNMNKRSLSSSEKIGDTNLEWQISETNLEWQRWSGSLPDGAVSIHNGYTGLTDYVCKFGCEVGFYSPSVDSFCHYSLKEKEFHESDFDILVNRGNLEFLEWKDDSHGSVPRNSVMACIGRKNVYVGKNKYGLGKVNREDKIFYLPWQGTEYWYKKYQVLTYDTDIYSERISDVKYNLNQADILRRPLKTMSKSTISNNKCTTVKKTATLSKTTKVARTWNINFSITHRVKASITAQIPSVLSAGIELSTETTFEYGQGTTKTESTTHSVSVEYKVPPNHSCSVRMVGYKYEANIPFTARLYRTYKNGKITWAHISGTYKGVQIGDVQAVVDRCVPLHNAKSCP